MATEDLVITVVPPPTTAEGPDDLQVIQPHGPTVTVLTDDLVTVPLAADLVIVTPLPDLTVSASWEGPPGPQGPPGAPGQAGASFYVAVAFQDLGGNRVVKPLPAGQVDYASSNVPSDGDQILGITQGAAMQGETVNVQTTGPMAESSWNWVVGGAVYCGLNGVLTQVPPTAGFLCRVGKATQPTEIFINVEEAIILI